MAANIEKTIDQTTENPTARKEGVKRALSRTLQLLLVAAVAAVGLVALAGSASASAYGCTGYGWQVGASRPQFCGQIDGGGTYVRTVGAGYSAPIAWAGTLCNTRAKIEFVDTSGRTYWTLISGQQNGCSAIGAWKWNIYGNVRYGHVRYSLLSNGATYAVVQHDIR